MAAIIVIFALLFVIPLALGIFYVVRGAQTKRPEARVPGVPLINPVALDRSPNMPHRRDATS